MWGQEMITGQNQTWVLSGHLPVYGTSASCITAPTLNIYGMNLLSTFFPIRFSVNLVQGELFSDKTMKISITKESSEKR